MIRSGQIRSMCLGRSNRLERIVGDGEISRDTDLDEPGGGPNFLMGGYSGTIG